MKRFGWTLVLGSMTFWLGCGGSTAQKETPKAGNSVATKAASLPSNTTPPAEVVAQFLDSVRRGDEDTTAKLFTQAAIQELDKYAIKVQPPGSPEATFQIGETRYTDDDKDSALVELFWTEVSPETGDKKKTEAVFAVRLENVGWRIAGMVVETEPGKEEVIDFENLAQMIEEAPASGAQPPASTQQVAGQVPVQGQAPAQGQAQLQNQAAGQAQQPARLASPPASGTTNNRK